MDTTDYEKEGRLREWANSKGLLLEKSPVRDPHADDHGLYWLLDPSRNLVVFAERHDASLDDIEEFLTQREKSESE